MLIFMFFHLPPCFVMFFFFVFTDFVFDVVLCIVFDWSYILFPISLIIVSSPFSVFLNLLLSFLFFLLKLLIYYSFTVVFSIVKNILLIMKFFFILFYFCCFSLFTTFVSMPMFFFFFFFLFC